MRNVCYRKVFIMLLSGATHHSSFYKECSIFAVWLWIWTPSCPMSVSSVRTNNFCSGSYFYREFCHVASTPTISCSWQQDLITGVVFQNWMRWQTSARNWRRTWGEFCFHVAAFCRMLYETYSDFLYIRLPNPRRAVLHVSIRVNAVALVPEVRTL